MRKQMINAIISHANGHISKHLANIEVYLNGAVGVGEHSDIMGTITKELEMIEKYNSQIEMVQKYLESKDYQKLLKG